MQVLVLTSARDLQRNKMRSSATTASLRLDAEGGGVASGQSTPGYGWDLREVSRSTSSTPMINPVDILTNVNHL